MDDPIEKFARWWSTALADTPMQHKSATCISTIGPDGFPSGRFVDLKAAGSEGFIFCTYLDSEKGRHISKNPKVALTIWWDHVGYQVRVKGAAELISDTEALGHWVGRSRDAQLATHCSRQSHRIETDEDLQKQLAEVKRQYQGQEVPKPASWGGYRVRPVSIEFLTFRENRLHKRELFVLGHTGAWQMTLLQP